MGYVEPKKRIVKKLSELMKEAKHIICEYGSGLSLGGSRKWSDESNIIANIQTSQNKLSQSSVDWDDYEIDNNADELCEELDEIINDMKLMANPNSWLEVIEMQVNDATDAVQKFIYYN